MSNHQRREGINLTDLFTPATAVPIGAAIAVAVFVVTTALKINNALRTQAEKINAKLTQLETAMSTVRDGMKETWSRKDQEIYSLKLQIRNPTLIVPDVQTVGVKPEAPQ